jgi:hypothetical protein
MASVPKLKALAWGRRNGHLADMNSAVKAK